MMMDESRQKRAESNRAQDTEATKYDGPTTEMAHLTQSLATASFETFRG